MERTKKIIEEEQKGLLIHIEDFLINKGLSWEERKMLGEMMKRVNELEEELNGK